MKRIVILVFLLLLLIVIPPYLTNKQFIIYLPLSIVFIVLFILFLRSFPLKDLISEFKKDRLGSLKNIIEIFALCFAGFYFLFHFVANLDITNLSLELTTRRQKIENSNGSFLVVDLKLSKGAIASVDLHSIKAYIYNLDTIEVMDSIIFYGYDRMLIFPEENFIKHSGETYTTHSGTIDKNKKYTLAANEFTQFSSFKRVNYDSPYRIEVVVITRRTKLLHEVTSQYRASTISLPQY